MGDEQWRELTGESNAIWEQNAGFWDSHMGEGNDFQLKLIGPANERLLELREGDLVVDAACGNGHFARRMGQLGAHVVAFDISPTFVERARTRTAAMGLADRVEYRVLDGTQREQMLTLGAGRFDAATCNMALMDMPEIRPLLDCLRELLKPGGKFVFSIMHPCFNSVHTLKFVEEEDREGDLITRYGLKVLSYISPSAHKGLGVIGQPAPQYYFHRPLSALLNECCAAGFVLDRIEEPVFGPEATSNRALSWTHFKEFPPVFVARMRAAATS
jgi:2-polyprenyl-3-methyl-5-hydroxy-6-metoxy-1,4-benzoquinol methylase